MFEKYQFDSCYIAVQAVLTLYAQGEYDGDILLFKAVKGIWLSYSLVPVIDNN